MLRWCLACLCQRVQRGVDALRTRVSRWTKPRPLTLAAGLATDLVRPRRELLLENACAGYPAHPPPQQALACMV